MGVAQSLAAGVGVTKGGSFWETDVGIKVGVGKFCEAGSDSDQAFNKESIYSSTQYQI